MKLKITLLFIVLAALLTVGIFKKDFSNDVSPEETSAVSTPLAAYKQSIYNQLLSEEVINYQEAKASLKNALNEKNVLIVHFWASWCSPCVNEIPELIKYAKKNQQKSENKKTIVVVSLDEDKENLVKFLKSFPELDTELFIRVWDNKNMLAKLVNADRLPMTVILDNNRLEPVIIRGEADWKNLE